ncbi:MAG: NAD-dependent epimerase/dehydratase family protein [Metallibacterium scheffleri]|jgi:UDP-glucose 4-epimerase|uniref:NAD-dependent epimerase/dehydratase family protein n=1 Tax=Metallibacterium scheffleri TaxID=993689 RepID=UPI0026EAE56C|nr:NAD-dependent epimerase/dehydratase family protein [Metallibacterium scheffleri]MCK9365955.1 NAD-dependent epimerase/dehydratase family protein [Metallibacterium scheffleri]
MRKVLVVGAAGFIGQHLVRALAAAGVSVVAQVHRRQATFGHDVHTISADATEATLLQDCDAVAWLASGTTPAASASDPLLELGSNLGPLLKLLHTLQTQPDCHLLYVSSGGTLYGDVAQPAPEALAAHPRSYYAAGKAAAEYFIAAYAQQYSATATVLRPSNVYGPGQTLHGGFGVIPAAMSCLREDKPMTLWGDGESLRDYLYIDDFVAACMAVLQQPPPRGMRVFNVCSEQATSLKQLLAVIEQVAGRPLRRDQRPARAVDLRRVLLDGARIRQELGWAPRTSLHDGLQRTWQWLNATRP